MQTNIEWTATYNPDGTITPGYTANFWCGCFKVSPGCKNCYAETLANRYGKSIWGPVETTDRELKAGIWKELPKWNKQAKADGIRRRVFVQSMSDFFEAHPSVITWRSDATLLMQECDWLDFQLLTKRPENISRMIPLWWLDNWPENIWIGTSVENQAMADKRIPELLNIPAKVRFLSMEPLLDEVDFDKVVTPVSPEAMRGIQWVIAGGESGNKHRPFNPDWARSIRDQCAAAGVPFFFKQIDKVQPIPADLMIREFPKV